MGVGIVWFREVTKRNAIHFYVLVAFKDGNRRSKGSGLLMFYRQKFHNRWFEIVTKNVGQRLEKHRRVGVHMKPLYSKKGLKFYALKKYAPKDATKRLNRRGFIGRHWGYSSNMVPSVGVTYLGDDALRYYRNLRPIFKKRRRMFLRARSLVPKEERERERERERLFKLPVTKGYLFGGMIRHPQECF